MTGRRGLSVTSVHKAFGDHAVLTGLDLDVPAGTFTTVLGSSGSGKTTLLRILAGFERPDSGVVEIDGTVLDDGGRHVPPEKRRLGYVSQEGSLFPHLNVRANVAFGLPRGQRRGPRVDELLETVGLAQLGRRFPHQLSGGQQQRVALARALAIGARTVLLDEPFASLDANLRASVRSDVKAILAATGATTILVSHDREEALSASDRVAVIRAGTIAQLGSPHEIYARPVDAELARFLGEVNLIDGIADGGTVETPLGTLTLDDPMLAGPVTALVRPEQLELTAGSGGRVIGSGFHGHDAIVRIASAERGLPAVLVARVRGGLEPADGSEVGLAVSGVVMAWHAERSFTSSREPVEVAV